MAVGDNEMVEVPVVPLLEGTDLGVFDLRSVAVPSQGAGTGFSENIVAVILLLDGEAPLKEVDMDLVGLSCLLPLSVESLPSLGDDDDVVVLVAIEETTTKYERITIATVRIIVMVLCCGEIFCCFGAT